jgi:maltose/moltooligosaccharide transporter
MIFNLPKIMKQLMGSVLFLVCSFFHVDIHYVGRDTTYLWHYRYHIWKHTIQELVGEMFANYNLIAAIAAFILPLLAKYTSYKITHFIALVCGGLGLISIISFKNQPFYDGMVTYDWCRDCLG